MFADRDDPRTNSRVRSCWWSPRSPEPSSTSVPRGPHRQTQLTLLSPRAGLVVEPGAKVTYNGVEIGRVAEIDMVDERGTPMAKLTLDVNPRYLNYIPANAVAEIRATTVFGNKYISFSSPEYPSPQRISSHDVIDAWR